MTLNNEQRNAAYCTGNAVIAAGAGSGKTMVLASRYAWLITEKKHRVREILTLTFTKKAAAQMYRRIHLMLAEIAADDSHPGKIPAQQALDEFAQARIQTLDSYCASIVRLAANRYGINPDFAIDEERCGQLAIDEALPLLIANRNHPALVRLYPQRSPMTIANNIFASALINYTYIDSSPMLEEDMEKQFTVICREWEKQSGLITEKLHELAEVYTGHEHYHQDLAPILRLFTDGKAVFPRAPELRLFFNQLLTVPHRSAIEWADSQPLPKAVQVILELLASICGLSLAKGSPRQNPAKEIIKELRVLFAPFSSLMVFCLQAALIYSVLSLINGLQQRYLNRKRSEGILTYSDVARLAKKILLEQHDIRQSEKESFKAIMIDEFQDNNELQKDLLFLLAEKPDITHNNVPPAHGLSPGKLFFVGDEKQSIYRFRGADVSVFRALKNELGSGDLPLKTNYRSAPLLIGAFNAIFGGSGFDPSGASPVGINPARERPAVFAPDEPPGLPPYEAAFTPLRADKQNGGKLTLCILDRQDEGEFDGEESGRLLPVENEARFVAERIKLLLQETDESGKTKYQPHDIAILFRSRNPQYLFEKHLMLLNIPYASEDLSGFFYGGPVNDLMSVLRLTAYPMDRAAYAQMLRSPFAGLSISGLGVCLAGLNDDSSNPFGDEPLSLLSHEDAEMYRHGQRIYAEIRAGACTKSISSLVSALWYGAGYRYETEWNPATAAYREMYDYLFHLAARADSANQTLAAFVDAIQNMHKNGERLSDIEIPLERPSAVNLMTIHKSKGLEFPVVFLCCCDKHGKNDFAEDIFHSGDAGLTINPPLPPQCGNFKDIKRNYFWERSVAVEKGKKTAELRRLLYVGMTRAENELYLSGCLGINSGGDNTAAFSVQVKQFIDAKTERAAGKNTVAGDTILEGNTFFGLCLPAFGAHIPPNGLEAQPSFFSIEAIPAYSEQYIHDAEQHSTAFSNDQKGLNAFFKKTSPFYESEHIITTPVVAKRHITPTSLRNVETKNTLPGNFPVSKQYSGDDASDVFNKVDTLLNRYVQHQFNSGTFGTVAHLCVEALLAGEKAEIPAKLSGFLAPADSDAFLEAGKEIALRFARSPLGVIARESTERKSEFPFRSVINAGNDNETYINGTIDLIFEDAQTVYVVDFKTDNQELPAEHIPQMACYYKAASDLFAVPANKECKLWLYYLRSGHAVDVTAPTQFFILAP